MHGNSGTTMTTGSSHMGESIGQRGQQATSPQDGRAREGICQQHQGKSCGIGVSRGTSLSISGFGIAQASVGQVANSPCSGGTCCGNDGSCGEDGNGFGREKSTGRVGGIMGCNVGGVGSIKGCKVCRVCSIMRCDIGGVGGITGCIFGRFALAAAKSTALAVLALVEKTCHAMAARTEVSARLSLTNKHWYPELVQPAASWVAKASANNKEAAGRARNLPTANMAATVFVVDTNRLETPGAMPHQAAAECNTALVLPLLDNKASAPVIPPLATPMAVSSPPPPILRLMWTWSFLP